MEKLAQKLSPNKSICLRAHSKGFLKFTVELETERFALYFSRKGKKERLSFYFEIKHFSSMNFLETDNLIQLTSKAI